MPQYAFSLNGENWSGAFESREHALAAAVQKCSGASDPPGTVFVAERVDGELGADQLGKTIVAELRSRTGAGDDQFLQTIAESQLAELDSQIERVVVGWLQKNRLMPQDSKVEAISEHLIPVAYRGLERSNELHEVQDLGVSDYPGS